MRNKIITFFLHHVKITHWLPYAIVSLGFTFESVIWTFSTGYFIYLVENTKKTDYANLYMTCLLFFTIWLIIGSVNILYNYLNKRLLPEFQITIRNTLVQHF